MPDKGSAGLYERMKIQEKALQALADRLKARESVLDEEMQDVLEEIKVIKLILSRVVPDFKRQYPEIRKKIKKAA